VRLAGLQGGPGLGKDLRRIVGHQSES
jgi:hypothetical protein